jgi:hypothetical protein
MESDKRTFPKTARGFYQKFVARFKTFTDQELIDAFNDEVGKQGWVSARGSYLAALHDEFIHRGFDFSAMGDMSSLSLGSKVKLTGKVLEPLDKSNPQRPSMIRVRRED